MIKTCNNADLENREIAEQYYLLYQVWKELTEARTLDSYQYKVMNTLSALRELNTVVEQYLKHYHNSLENINKCQAETLQLVKADVVIKKYYPNLYGQLLTHLSDSRGNDIDKGKEAKLHALRHQIAYCYRRLNQDYMERLFAELEHDVVSSEDESEVKSNIGIILKSNMVISNCAAEGWSNKALHNMIDMLIGSKTDPSKWENFKKKVLNRESDSYIIFMPLKLRVKPAKGQSNEQAKSRVNDEIRDLGIKVSAKADVEKEYPEVFEQKKLGTCKYYMMLEVQAYDYYAAAHKAISRFSNVLNLLSFYNLIEAWSVREANLVIMNAETKNMQDLKAGDLYITYDYMEGAVRIFKNSKKIEKYQGGTLQTKLRAAYSYANMGKAASTQEEKFMNAWVALESLCRSEASVNIIKSVLDVVPPALCIRYIYRHFRNFYEDCVRCGVEYEMFQLDKDIQGASKEELVCDIIKTLNNQERYQNFLQKCRVNNLLYERCEQLHEMIATPDKMFQRINRHYTNVEQQLSRLYRLRNEIAHSALQAEAPLILYIEHLEDYLSGFVSELIIYADKYQEENIEVIFELIKDNYRQYKALIEEKKGVNKEALLQSLLETGVISLME